MYPFLRPYVSWWKKLLSDGSIELGSDELINLGVASWTKGRNDIIGVELRFTNRIIRIMCAPVDDTCAKWTQRDSMVASAHSPAVRVARTVGCIPGHPYFVKGREGVVDTITFIDSPHSGAVPIHSAEEITFSIRSNGRLEVMQRGHEIG